MAFRERTVTGTLVDGDGTPIQTANVSFKPTKPVGYTATHVVVDKIFTVTTDSSGVFSATLWCDEDSLVAIDYTVTFPIENSGSPDSKHTAQISLAYEDGSDKDIGTLIAESNPAPEGVTSETWRTVVEGVVGKGTAPFPGLYPNPKYPRAYIASSASGHNDIYTVPAGRKAVLTDVYVTNSTGAGILYYPEIKIGGVYYRLGSSTTESAGGIGHNYGFNGAKSIPIILNAGESVSVNCDSVGLTVWCSVVEFDESSPLSRATISSWTAGANTLLIVGVGRTVSLGGAGLNVANNPGVVTTGVCYVNGSGSTRTLSSVNVVKSGDAVAATNQFAGSNSVVNASLFAKYHPGNLEEGDSIVLTVDANTAGQFAWVNYMEV